MGQRLLRTGDIGRHRAGLAAEHLQCAAPAPAREAMPSAAKPYANNWREFSLIHAVGHTFQPTQRDSLRRPAVRGTPGRSGCPNFLACSSGRRPTGTVAQGHAIEGSPRSSMARAMPGDAAISTSLTVQSQDADRLPFLQVQRLGPGHALADAQPPAQQRRRSSGRTTHAPVRGDFAAFLRQQRGHGRIGTIAIPCSSALPPSFM